MKGVQQGASDECRPGEELRRGRTKTAEALAAFLDPGSIAVVGASTDPDTISGLLFANLLASRFNGTVMPVNKKHPVVQGVAAYPDLASCPVVPDLVIVCVPARATAAVVAEAGDLGVTAVCVISAGFAETGPDGASLQEALVAAATARHVRLIGPNCTGILSGHAGRRFNATFSRTVPPPGRTCLLSQSGAIGLAVLEAAEVRGLGIGGFVSVGNSVDVAGNDLLTYWGGDAETDLVLLYLESIPDPRAFVQIAGALGRRIPLVAVKAGRTEAGRRGAASHTAALTTGDVATDALLSQAGVIRADSIEEMADLATLLATQQRFTGRRVAIVTNGGGPGVLAADACEANGLVVPSLSGPTAAALRRLLAPEASVSNPVDMIAAATAHEYGETVRVLGASGEVDALLVIFNTPLLTSATDVAKELVSARAGLDPGVALLAVFMNKQGPPQVLRDACLPAFSYPENAVRALARSVTWAERRRRPPGEVLRPEVDAERVDLLVAEVKGRSRNGWLAAGDAETLLAAYGVALPRVLRVRSPEEAAAAQDKLGITTVVKIAATVHKSDVGGVRLGVTTPAGAAAAVRSIREGLTAAGMAVMATEFLVQEQVGPGLEMIVGARKDPVLGPLVMVGLGGTLVELLGDVAVRLAPLSDLDVQDMLSSLKCYRLLTGFRGTSALDVAALSRVLHAVSALSEDLPDLVELDLNPVFVLEKGAVAADVRLRLGPGAGNSGELPIH